ncbi:hypothetical protein N7454_000698 [Penicillium verhagenii]|nr:hypothetical protein N7454_000698 [Penicillium verhagenii]
MAKQITQVNLNRVQNEKSIAAIARTVNASFSSDPLIRWLRPDATTWDKPDDSVWKWQYRRIQSVLVHGEVLQSGDVQEMSLKFPRKQRESTESVEPDTTLIKEAQSSVTASIPGADDAGAVVFLFPPKEQLRWSLSKLWLTWKLFLLEILKPAYDDGCKKSRVDQLLAANKNGLESVQAQHSKQKMWYLEVIAVHPSLQARGIGGGVMRSILQHVGDQPIYLECTRQENIGFYESFGFQVVEEVELLGGEQNLKFWAMVRSGQGSSESR